MPTPSLMLTAAAGALLFVAPTPDSKIAEAPPGMVAIKGGRIPIGSTPKQIKPLVEANEPMAQFLVAETPQNDERIDDFYLMVTEVTNEQYAAFVTATDGRPPYTWGAAAIERGRMEWFEEDNKKRQEAKEAGRRYISQDKFEPERWWNENWEGAEWEVPTEIADHPVTYVSFEDAQAYAKWAGVRLMTEFEYQCAARGSSNDLYPWGKEWESGKAASLEAGRDKTWPIASFPGGARDGVFDLAGNVWEWTSSPYTPYDGYEALTFEFKRRKEEVTPLAPFDANERVLVGGSMTTDALALRATTRMPSRRDQRTNAIGFRCAASLAAGLDLGEYLVNDAIRGTVRPEGVEYETITPVLLHRWISGPPEDGGERPEGYSIITGYDAMLFVPVSQIDAGDVRNLNSESEDAPIHLGMFWLTKPLVEPALEPGAYMVAYRHGAELPKLAETDLPPAWRSTPNLDPMKASYIFYDAEGEPVTAWALGTPADFGKLSEGSANLVPWVPPAKVDKDAPPLVPRDTLRFHLKLKSRVRNRAFVFDMPFLVEPGTIDDTWHK